VLEVEEEEEEEEEERDLINDLKRYGRARRRHLLSVR